MESIEAKVSSLKAENAWLRGLLFIRTQFMPQEWELCSLERKTMALLMSRQGVIPTSYIIETIYAECRRGEPEDPENAVRCVMKTLRKKLAPFDITITNVAEVGYYLTPSGKELVLRELRAKHD